ncbi:MAG TPA: TonB-dependent receptor [Gammaproteobacteria bacterium]|nr:TonB-dependent receptor [Gammaproteobacteria bacterium]
MQRIFLFMPILAACVISGLPVQAATQAPAAETIQPPAASGDAGPAARGTGNTVQLGSIRVQGERLNEARATINVATGTSSYRFDTRAIATLPQGYNSPLQNVLLQAPGVAQDSFGQLHVRGDHADIQYRINGIIVPEFISGFGDTLGTRFIDKIDFLTGALPAQYGYRTAGVVNITTNDGLNANGGTVDLYGGSHGTFEPSVEYGGTEGWMNYYVTGTYLQSNAGIESPTPGSPIHDDTEQNRGFGYMSYILNDNMRLGAVIGHSLGNFQIPNNPGQTPQYQLQGVTSYPSADLNETQRELNDYGILSLQGIKDQLNYSVALFSRYSSTDYSPDPIGDLIYNGVAAQVFQRNIATGIQADASYALNSAHTLRWGFFVDQENTTSKNTSAVFPANANGNQTSDVPFTIVDNGGKTGELYGAYMQDEWLMTQALTLNYGLRYDISNGYVRQDQLSPRLNFVYALNSTTNIHGGYSRYFTPPALELISPTDIALFQGTTNQLPSNSNTNVVAERDNYYDLGINHYMTPSWQVGLDGYYKDATDLLDEGQFGQALVYSPFNYARGRVWGIEFNSTYQVRDFSSYFNMAYSRALGNEVVSGQYNFDQAELDYIANHLVHLDHDQTWTGSGGVAYEWQGTRYSLDAIFGSGLRAGFANTQSLPSYAQFDLAASRQIHLAGAGDISVRVVIINLFDRVYEIRNGSGIGVGAPQYGPRRGFYIGLNKPF